MKKRRIPTGPSFMTTFDGGTIGGAIKRIPVRQILLTRNSGREALWLNNGQLSQSCLKKIAIRGSYKSPEKRPPGGAA